MAPPVSFRSPVVEAEQARQVVGVLAWVERRFADGDWGRGARFGAGGRVCILGGIDEASGWTMHGVADQATRELAARLPRSFQPIAHVRPRLAIAIFNDVAGRQAALRLVTRTRQALGGGAATSGRPTSSRSPAVAVSGTTPRPGPRAPRS